MTLVMLRPVSCTSCAAETMQRIPSHSTLLFRDNFPLARHACLDAPLEFIVDGSGKILCCLVLAQHGVTLCRKYLRDEVVNLVILQHWVRSSPGSLCVTLLFEIPLEKRRLLPRNGLVDCRN